VATKKNDKAAPKPKPKKAVAAKTATKKPVKAQKVTKPAKPEAKPKRKMKVPKFLRPIGDYFKGAWSELRQVRWPNRRATWALTLAVIVFTLFWVGIILGLDTIYQFLFNELIL
jgi:preprotein translocase SecE subunit